ncbi:MAG: putative signaling protein [Stenotrophomonas maltophilia]|nr:MAG: putative signaling protein [Stenotrophomonas maltophilia]
MTAFIETSSGPTSPAEIHQRFSRELAVERTRLLYQGSRVPTLLMLLNGAACAGLLRGDTSLKLLAGWLIWLVTLAVLRLVQVSAFNAASLERQADPRWQRMFLFGAGASGLTLAFAATALVPADAFVQQVLVFGLIGATILSASVAYAVSLPAFLTFALPCLLPSTIYLLTSDSPQQQGWGVLGVILFSALLVVAWQVNRLVQGTLLRRFQNQALIERLEQARTRAEALNSELVSEVQQRRQAERELRQARDALQVRVEAGSEQLSQSEARLALALEASGLGLWDWNLVTDEVHHSRLREIFGLEAAEVTSMRGDLRPRVHPEDLPLLRNALLDHVRGHTDGYRIEYRVRHAEGHWVWVEDRGRVMARDRRGKVTRVVGTRADIAVRKRHDEEQRLAATVFEAASEGIVILDDEYRLLAVNSAFTRVTGYQPDEVVGRLAAGLSGSTETLRQYQQIRGELETLGSWQGELTETRKNGELYPQWLQLNVVRDAQGEVANVVGFFADLTARRDAEDRLRYLSHYDELTGLANRVLFKERLHDAGQRARRTGRGLALLLIDLDRFKLLNDSLGHEVGDQLLREVARRLTQLLPEADTLARLSGDEFAVLIDSYVSLAALSRLSGRLLTRLREPIEVAGQEWVLSASLGISLLPDSAREISALMSQANMAMQHARRLGGNTFQFFTENLQASSLERLQLEAQLRHAIELGQLEVHYQPKLNLASERLDSAEALVRWRHPQQGMIAPAEFIPLAEETGLIGAIGEFVLRQACAQARLWMADGLDSLRVSVNLSVHQLRQGNLVTLVRTVLKETGLPPHCLELELTESQLLDNVDSVSATLRQLREMGVKLAIDDFGTGYASLSYLKRFPVDYVKIDKTFIRDLSERGEDAAITRAVIAMVHGLELKVVAEGVEHEQQLDFLRRHGCDEIQGYLISRPLPAADCVHLLGRPVQR